jgi:hypothetical protein
MFGAEHREIDVACYAKGDDYTACVGQPAEGLEVIVLTGKRGGPLNVERPAPAAPLRAEVTEFTPQGKRKGSQKYILAEAYSGSNEEKVKEKVRQLESMLDFMLRRFNDLHSKRVTDITELVGSAMLMFSYKTGQRRGSTLSARVATVACMIQTGQTGGPHLKRLALARRLAVMVLDTSQAPQSHAQRLISRALAGRLDIVDENE